MSQTILPSGKKVYMGLTHPGMIHFPFFNAMWTTHCQDREQRGVLAAGPLAAEGHYAPDQANKLVESFLAMPDGEWLWFVEYDHTFDVRVLYTLLDIADPKTRPIVGALYFVHLDNPDPTAQHHRVGPVFLVARSDGLYGTVEDIKLGKLYKVDVTGLGCTLVHRSVFETMRACYLAPWHWFGHDQGPDCVFGHDVTFFRRVGACGIPVFGYTGIVLPHIKKMNLGVAEFEAYEQEAARGRTDSVEDRERAVV